MVTISLIFMVVLSVIIFKDIRAVNKSISKSEHNIRNSIIAKGNTLANNNSMAMSVMAEDNAFTAIQNLVSSTVKDDSDITYGIYMDIGNMAWAYASSENPSGVPENSAPLTDEMSKWAGSLDKLSHRMYTRDNDEIIEFAAPVRVEEDIFGFIRYGISTRAMHEALQEALADGIRSRNQTIAVLLFLGMLSLIGGYLIVIRQSARITLPIASLVGSARTIAEGDYNIPVESDTNDELGLLVSDVEKMRLSIKDLTDNLEEQVKDRTTELADANNELKNTLENLKKTQGKLVESEKMAALGQLIAGVAHEINNPIGAIRASVDNITSALTTSIEQLPQLFQRLSQAEQDDFFALLNRALNSRKDLSSKEERKAKRKLIAYLETEQIEDAEFIGDTLIDMGIYEDIQPFMPIFEQENSAHVLQAAYNLSAQHHNNNIILNAVERASKIVFALKSYARYDASGDMIRADVTEGIEVVLTLYHNWLKKGVEVIRKYDRVPAIPCYPDELNQVWTNLIHNAIQAMDSHGTIEIAVFLQDSHIVVCVTDSGCGISDEIKERIFEPFFTTRPPGEGSGLGLDIVWKIIERHKGEIEVESRPGRTSFKVLLAVQD